MWGNRGSYNTSGKNKNEKTMHHQEMIKSLSSELSMDIINNSPASIN